MADSDYNIDYQQRQFYDRGSPYRHQFQSPLPGLESGMQNMARALAIRRQLPALQAQAAQRSGLIDAQTDSARATAGKTSAETQELIRKGSLVDKLQQSAPVAMRAFATGKLDDPSIDDFTGAAAALTGENKQDIQASMKTGLATMLARQGNVPAAAAVQNPVSVQNNAVNADTREKIAAENPVVVPQGGSLFTKLGTLFGIGTQKVAPGQEVTAPVENGDPATPAVMATGEPLPAKSGAGGNARNTLVAKLLDKVAGGSIDQTNVAPYLNQYDQMTAAPRAAAAPAATPAAAPASPAPAAAVVAPAAGAQAAATGKVRMQHPNGTFGFVPAEQVAAAQVQGYKIAQ